MPHKVLTWAYNSQTLKIPSLSLFYTEETRPKNLIEKISPFVLVWHRCFVELRCAIFSRKLSDSLDSVDESETMVVYNHQIIKDDYFLGLKSQNRFVFFNFFITKFSFLTSNLTDILSYLLMCIMFVQLKNCRIFDRICFCLDPGHFGDLLRP